MKIGMIGDSHSQVIFPMVSSALSSAGHPVSLQVSRPGLSEKAFLNDADLWSQIAYAKPERMIIALGGNNMEGASYVFTTLGPLISRLREAGVKDILWIGPFRADEAKAPSTAARHATTNGYLTCGLLTRGVTFVDVYDLTDLAGSNDGVHLTPAAYRRVVEQIKPQLLAWARGEGSTALVLGVPRLYVFAGAGVFSTLLFALLLRRRSRRRR